MNIDANQPEVTNNEAASQFEAQIDGAQALLAYHRSPDAITFTHTEVPSQLAGRGLASRLAQVALDYARAERLMVVPRCPFVASYIRKHPEYADLVAAKQGA